MTAMLFFIGVLLIAGFTKADDCVGEQSLKSECGDQDLYVKVKETNVEMTIQSLGEAEGEFPIEIGGITTDCKVEYLAGHVDIMLFCDKSKSYLEVPITVNVSPLGVNFSSSNRNYALYQGKTNFIAEEGSYYVNTVFGFPNSKISISLSGSATFINMLPSTRRLIIILSSVFGSVGLIALAIGIGCWISCCICREGTKHCAKSMFRCRCCSLPEKRRRKAPVASKPKTPSVKKAASTKKDVSKKKSEKKPDKKRATTSAPAKMTKTPKKPEPKPKEKSEGLRTCRSDSSLYKRWQKDKNFGKIKKRLDEPVRDDELITIGKTLSDESVKMKLTEDSQRKMSKSYDRICIDDSEKTDPNEPKRAKGQDMRYMISQYKHKIWAKDEPILTMCPIPEAEMIEKYPRVKALYSVPYTRMHVRLYLLPLRQHPIVMKEVLEVRARVEDMIKDIDKCDLEFVYGCKCLLSMLRKIERRSIAIVKWRKGEVPKEKSGVPDYPWAIEDVRQFGYLSLEDLEFLDAVDPLTKEVEYFIGAWMHEVESYLLWTDYEKAKGLGINEYEKKKLMELQKTVIDRLRFMKYLYEKRLPATVLSPRKRSKSI